MELNGNLTQLQRLEAIEHFQSPENGINILFATDLAARGIDIPSIAIVINLNLPRSKTLYVHRVGRTARAGLHGRSISIIGDGDRKTLKEILKAEKKQIISSDTSIDKNDDEKDSKKKGKKKEAVAAVLSSRIQSRIIPSELIAKWGERIMSKESDLKEIIAAERAEREQRKAEMEMNKVSNKIVYADEIASRPAKTWFQSHKDKMAAKASAERNFDDPRVDNPKLSSKEKRKLEDDERKAKSKKDKLKNDFNFAKQAKRKTLKKTTSKFTEPSLQEREFVDTEDFSVRTPSTSHPKKRKRNDGETDSQSHKKKGKIVYASTENVSKRFTEQTREMDRKKSVATANSKKKASKTSKSGFHSKNKHKRR
jgi:ATP-dependent RNA helicase DDX27